MTQMRRSEESNREQLKLARRQGDALQAVLDAMDEESESGVLTREAGDYEIGVAVEEAEGLWQWQDGELRWQSPDAENCHVEVCVRDRADGRFIPGLDVTATLVGPDGRESEPRVLPFLWHPWLYHYGSNWSVPRAGEYGIRVAIAPPTFMRHDHENGCRYLEPVEVMFDGVEIEPDRKTVE